MIVQKLQLFLVVLILIPAASCMSGSKSKEQTNKLQENIPGYTSLFDGKTLEGWEVTNFGTQGPVEAYDGKIVINYGDGASGITWTKEPNNPVLDVGVDGDWDDMYAGGSSILFNSTDSTWKMWYHGGNGLWKGSIGYATSPSTEVVIK